MCRISSSNLIRRRVVDMTTATYPVVPCTGDARGFYQVLGVSRTATTAEIHKARKAELRAWHPDHAAEREREVRGQRATLINEAADTLVDPVRRYRYDHIEYRDPRDEVRRREQAAAQAEQAAARAEQARQARAEQARRARAEQARRNQQAAADAEARRRAAAEQAQREAEEAAQAERTRVRLQLRRQVAHALWCLTFLTLLPHVAFHQLFIPLVDVYIDIAWTSTLLLALALVHLWVGAATRVFNFQSERSRTAANVLVVLQIAAAAIVLFLAPAVLLLFELLKIAAFLFGILFILMVLSS
jgi:cation transport ATPase